MIPLLPPVSISREKQKKLLCIILPLMYTPSVIAMSFPHHLGLPEYLLSERVLEMKHTVPSPDCGE